MQKLDLRKKMDMNINRGLFARGRGRAAGGKRGKRE
jgi:hypothetical protein